MKILVIYWNCPESVEFYSFEGSDEALRWLDLTHGYYVNQVFNKREKPNKEACLRLMDLVQEMAHLDKSQPFTSHFDKIISTGFIL